MRNTGIGAARRQCGFSSDFDVLNVRRKASKNQLELFCDFVQLKPVTWDRGEREFLIQGLRQQWGWQG